MTELNSVTFVSTELSYFFLLVDEKSSCKFFSTESSWLWKTLQSQFLHWKIKSFWSIKMYENVKYCIVLVMTVLNNDWKFSYRFLFYHIGFIPESSPVIYRKSLWRIDRSNGIISKGIFASRRWMSLPVWRSNFTVIQWRTLHFYY